MTPNQTDLPDSKAGSDEPIRVLIVDDHPMLRKGVIDLLQLEEGFQSIGEASSGEEACEIATKLEPDLILLDLNMKGMDGIETIRQLRSRDIFSRIVIFSVSDNHEDVVSALKAGADGYILKDTEPEELVSYIQQAVNGKLAISDNLAGILATAIKDNNSSVNRAVENLTYREKQILSLIASGLSNKMIARELTIAEGTVKVHVKNLLKKLKMRSRVEAAIWAMEQNIK
ncbi:two-component response regulator NarL [Oleiphilus messinensis]|uniref:Two-component response regulator NarL n=1 Tax=Oleiphilus messinensis TaxID=141451 RepID=A0A1Y0I473_9GAMM|nr:two-component system response regulator NarL [Oleiphilus messinensis]ARU54193.1 two-component response regulator NarL [Oleiphilus messinensis]